VKPTRDKATRGYALKVCNEFALSEFGAARRNSILGRLPPEVSTAFANLNDDDWYARTHQCAIFRAIAAEWSTNEDVYAGMVRLGMAMAKSVTNVFMRLTIRILLSNPAILAKKLPGLYKMDNTGDGHVEVDTSNLAAHAIVFTWKDMHGYEYHQPICEGWLRFFFATMGKGHATFASDPWSHERPDPEQFNVAIQW
jgi:hypothetical protein